MNTKLSTQKTILFTACAAGTLMMAGCSSSSDNNTVAPPTTSLYSMNISGGIGGSDGGTGGDASYFEVEKYGVGDIVLTNKVDVLESTPARDFEEPTVSIVDTSAFTPRDLTGLGALGDVPMMVTAATTLTVLTTGDAKPAAGTYYQLLNNDSIYVSDGTGTVPTGDDSVTGINIASGATLTLGLNRTSYTSVNLDNDMVNHGLLTKVEFSATDRGNLQINPGSYIATGNINNQGTQDAQDGGYVYISADYSIFNQGDINASGSDSAVAATDAGDGDYIDFSADIIENTGNLTATGGSATDGAGGNAGYIGLYADWGNAYSSGTLDAHGGNGTTAGGQGNSIDIYAENTGESGDLKVSGTLSTYGGDATAGNAGDADYVYFYAEGAAISSSASINSYGGSTTDAASNGGDGDYFEIYNDTDDFYNANDETAIGDTRITGNINTSGGNAVATGTGNGGDAGYVYVYHYPDDQPQFESSVKFMGYDGINVSGGNGNNGGDGDGVELYVYEEDADNNIDDIARGSVYNDLPIDATGGDVVATDPMVAASAGRGGYLYFETPYYLGAASPDSLMVVNTGDIDTSAGSGSINNTSTSSSRGGSVYMWGYNGVENTGALTTNGGSDVATDGGTDGYGGYSGEMEMYSDRGAIANSGALAVNGGNGEYRGGYSDDVYQYGASVANSGDISANGGNATATLAGSTGGDGGYVELHSPNYSSSSNSGAVSYAGGTGETAGDEGAFVVGGLCTGADC